MKRILLFAVLLFSLSVNANELNLNTARLGIITGRVLDDETKSPLPYVSIIVKHVDGTITGGVTDDDGNFTVKGIAFGKNSVEISFIGYKSIVKSISLTDEKPMIKLATLYLKESSNTLDEVTVIAETSTVEQKIDRKVINVGKDLTSAGTTASELLNNVQSVSVDSQTGAISLRGNENVRVLIDGKPSNMNAGELLKQIPSTSIKSVELITNPSAKYNPEGMSGIINIVLHKNANIGFNGSVIAGVVRGLNSRYNGSLDMNFKKGKVNFFTNYGYKTGKSDNYGMVDRKDGSFLQDFTFDDDRTSHLLKFGADYYINDKNTFSVYTIQNNSDNYATGRTIITNDLGAIENNSPTTSAVDNTSETYNFNYTLDFNKEGERLELEANISTNKNPEVASFKDEINSDDQNLNYQDEIKNTRTNKLYNLDYTNPISKTAKLELGLEARFNESSNDRKTTQEDVENSNFEYNRTIYSAYVNYNQQIDKVSMQLGARLEQYEVEGDFTSGTTNEPYTDEIFTVYPSVFVTYAANEKNQFQWSYSRRVDRPSLEQVNPIRQWSTPQITSIGNPELEPQFTNSFEFNYTKNINKGSITFGTFYREVNANISRILNVDAINKEKIELSYANLPKSDRYGVELSLNYALRNWWRINASTDLYVQKENGISAIKNNADEFE